MGSRFSSLMRQFRSAPAWTAAVVLVLTLGIGTALSGWALVDAVLLRPLGVHDESRLLRLGATGADRQWLNSNSWPVVESYQSLHDVFSDVAAEGWPDRLHWRMPGGDERMELQGRAVTGNFFDVMGVKPLLGRTLLSRDDRAGADPVVVVSHRFWRNRLGGSTDVLGRMLRINATAYTVVGVVGPEFRGTDLTPLDVWMAARPNLGPAEIWTSTNWNMFEVFGRLRPGVTSAQANAAVDALAKSAAGWGGSNRHAIAVPLSRLGNAYRDGDAVKGASLLGFGIVAVLLLTCVNGAGLLLVRTERRRGELAVRSSIGASPWRLARQLAAESALLVALGTALGVMLAWGLAYAVLALAGAPGVLGLQDLRPPTWERAAIAVAAVALVAGVVCMAPLLRVAFRGTTGLRPGVQTAPTGRRWRAGRSLVAAQFALSLVVVSAAFTFLVAYASLWGKEVGVANAEALVMRLDYGVARDDLAGMQERNARVLAALKNHPAIAAAAIAPMVPVSGASLTTTPIVSGITDPAATDGFLNPVSDDYFDTLGIGLRAGRHFAARDERGEPVVIVSDATAKRIWPDRDPLGQTVRLAQDAQPATVIGVVANVKYQSLDEPARNVWYVPLAQMEFGSFFHVVALPRAGQAAAAAAAMRNAAMSVEPERATAAVETIDHRIDRTVAGPRFVAAVTVGFGALALLLAGVGIYGAFAYLVSMRRRELGLRKAVGASPRGLVGMVLRDAGGLIALGVGAGLVLGAAAQRVLGAIFRDLPAVSAELIAWSIATVTVAGLIAVSRPAAEAAAVDPMASLRCD